jgi:hypothetical protein
MNNGAARSGLQCADLKGFSAQILMDLLHFNLSDVAYWHLAGAGEPASNVRFRG